MLMRDACYTPQGVAAHLSMSCTACMMNNIYWNKVKLARCSCVKACEGQLKQGSCAYRYSMLFCLLRTMIGGMYQFLVHVHESMSIIWRLTSPILMGSIDVQDLTNNQSAKIDTMILLQHAHLHLSHKLVSDTVELS